MTDPAWHPNPRVAIENLWDRATPVGPLLDAYRTQVLTEAAQLMLHKRDFLNDVTDPAEEAHALLLAARTITTQED